MREQPLAQIANTCLLLKAITLGCAMSKIVINPSSGSIFMKEVRDEYRGRAAAERTSPVAQLSAEEN